MTGVAACILAGGRARRLGGRAKSLVAKAGASVLDRQLDVLAPRAAAVLISVAPGAPPLPVPARWADRVRVVEDAAADAGPLAGIAAGLAACPAPWLLVVAGDLPELDPGVVELLIAEAAAGEGIDAIAPRVRGLPEPLCAVYAAAVAPVAARRLAEGRRKASGLLTDEGLRVRWIDEARLRAIDPELRTLRDLDTPDDLARWQAE